MSVIPVVATPPEAPVTEAPAAPEVKAEEALSPKYAALAKAQREFRSQQQALKAREDALKIKMSEYETKYIPKDRISSDPISLLLENGFTYEQIAQKLLDQAGPRDPYQTRMEAKIAELEKKAQEPLKKLEEIESKQYEQAVAQIRIEAKALVDSDPAYETIKEMGAHEAVVSLIEKTYKETGELYSVAQASQLVEDELLNRALKMAGLAKVKAKLTPAEAVAQVEPKKQGITTQLKTLTNAQVASPSKPKNAMDRVQRAHLAFKGQLNQ